VRRAGRAARAHHRGGRRPAVARAGAGKLPFGVVGGIAWAGGGV
ncbi:MAG: hypothetical protein AVDCRST_MAG39-2192, partial [uncultured Sphingomonadaceae bacterium]